MSSNMSITVKRSSAFRILSVALGSIALHAFSGVFAEEGELWSYEEAYKKSVKQVCEKAWNPSNGSVIRTKELSYPEIGAATADTQYRK